MTEKKKYDTDVILAAAKKESARWLKEFRLDGKYDITDIMRHMSRPGVISMVVNGPNEVPFSLFFSIYWYDLFLSDKFFQGKRFAEAVASMATQRRLSPIFLNTIQDNLPNTAEKPDEHLETAKKVWQEISGQFVIQLLKLYLEETNATDKQFYNYLLTKAEPASCSIQLSDKEFASVWNYCKSKFSRKYSQLEPWHCIWDYYCFAFYESAFAAIEEKPPFLQHSYFNAFKAGLGFLINQGLVMIGMPLPEVHRDDNVRNRLHHETKAAVVWGDGNKSWWWHGIQVTQQLIEQPETIDPLTVVKMSNQELRRAHIEKMGYDRIAAALNLKIITKDDYGELLESKPNALADDGQRPARFVRVKCPSTGRIYLNRVDPTVTTCLQGLAQRFGVDSKEYIKLTES